MNTLTFCAAYFGNGPMADFEHTLPLGEGMRRASGYVAALIDRAASLLRAQWADRSRPSQLHSETVISLVQFDEIAANLRWRERLRERLRCTEGAADLEFLVAVRSFETAGNALQRYQHLTHIVHTHVRSGCSRPALLDPATRKALIREWVKCSKTDRVPVNASLPALERAAAAVRAAVVEESGDLTAACTLKLLGC
jgi:hypothetical protein